MSYIKRVMIRSRRWSILGASVFGGAALVGAALLLSSFGSPTSEPTKDAKADASDLDFHPSDEDRTRMAALVAGLSAETPNFPAAQAREKRNAKLFTYMAAESDDRRVVEASLHAISSAYSSRSSLKETPDADLDRVLLKYLSSSDEELARKAIDAARIPLMMESPSSVLMDAFVRMSAPSESPARRHAAVESLNLLPPPARSPRVLEALVAALDAPPTHLVSAALFALEQSGPSLSDGPALAPLRAALGRRAAELTKHTDPGVQGRALALLATLDGLLPPGERAELFVAALEAAHPYVRAAAADAVARVDATGAVPKLLPLAEDLGVARFEIVGWQTLGGEPGRVLHTVPGRRLVAEAALHALAKTSRGELVLSMSGPQLSPEEIRTNAERARVWAETRSRQ